MSQHENAVNDRVDLGHRVFLASFFVPLALGAALAVVGYGQTRSVWVALAGFINPLLLIAAAQTLYAGNRHVERAIWLIAVLFIGLALAVAILGRNLAAYHLAAQLWMPALFALLVACPAARDYLAHQRGEAVHLGETPSALAAEGTAEPQAIEYESILTASADGVGVALREDAKRPALNYSRALRLAAGLLVLVALGGIAAAVQLVLSRGTGWLLIFAALASLPLAAILLGLADDWYFLATTKGYEKAHLANILEKTGVLNVCATVSVIVLALLALLDVAMR